jgi:hypothetical protein
MPAFANAGFKTGIARCLRAIRRHFACRSGIVGSAVQRCFRDLNHGGDPTTGTGSLTFPEDSHTGEPLRPAAITAGRRVLCDGPLTSTSRASGKFKGQPCFYGLSNTGRLDVHATMRCRVQRPYERDRIGRLKRCVVARGGLPAKKKMARRASADLWTTKRPDERLANPFTEKSDEEFVRGNQTGGWGVTVSQASA